MIVFLSVTNSCSFSCTHCFLKYAVSPKRNMSFTTVEKILEELEKDEENHLVVFLGGEPFEEDRKFFRKILRKRREYEKGKTKFSFLTNLVSYSPVWDKIIEELCDSKIEVSYDVTRSLDNSRGRYLLEWYRNFEKIREKFDVGIRVTLTSVAIKYGIDYWVNFLSLTEPCTVSFNHYICTSNDPLKVGYGEYIDFILCLSEELRKAGKRPRFHPIGTAFNYDSKISITSENYLSGSCYQSRIAVSPDGTFGFCPILLSWGYTLGNFLEDGLNEVKKKSEKFFFKEILNAKCNCDYFGIYCWGGCFAERVTNGNQSLEVISKGKCKKYYDYLLFLAEEYSE
ncbi:MAG: radical SAM protein [Leptospiraceae bacterium]|nr:radical SAM protein [Leptospiraceae bacterium]